MAKSGGAVPPGPPGFDATVLALVFASHHIERLLITSMKCCVVTSFLLSSFYNDKLAGSSYVVAHLAAG